MMFWKPGYYSRCSLGYGLDGPEFGKPEIGFKRLTLNEIMSGMV
jgi:hypothetical protein